ncbi:MFS transporter [Corynebacterium mendelii]|uniref:MFS transporter n=1 Tax=Corynebacterium mendelii TaxID=2765362 RepID=A0A939E074_9CORY|nr:MFS transporter [Corynebacterium mendelii]
MAHSVTTTDLSRPLPHRWWGLAVLSVGVAVLAVDATVLNLAVPAITGDLDPTATQLLWIVDVYAFCVAAFLVTSGTLSDRVGPKKILLAGAMVFAVVSVLAGLAPTAGWLIVWRAAQGVAGSMLMPATLSLIGELFDDEKEKSFAVSVWIAVYAVGAAAGPIIGGALLEHFHWGSVFFINVPLCAIIAVGVSVLVPEAPVDRAERFDLPGAVLTAVMLFSMVYAVKSLTVHGLSPAGLACAVVAVAAGWLARRHLLRVKHPLIDLKLFHNRALSTVIAVNFVQMFIYLGVLFYISQYLQVVLGLGPESAALHMAPGLLCAVIGNLTTGKVMTRYRPRTLILVGMTVTCLGCLIFAACGAGLFAASGHTALVVAIGLMVTSIGGGIVDPVTNYFIVSTAPKGKAAAAASLSETGYEMGGAFGIAILGSVVAAVYRMGVDATGLLPEAARESVTTAHRLAESPAAAAAADQAFSTGVLVASVVAATVTAVAVAAVVVVIPARAARPAVG